MKFTALVFITLCVAAVFCQDSTMEKMQLPESSKFAPARARLIRQGVQWKDHSSTLENQNIEHMPSDDETGEDVNYSMSSRKIRSPKPGETCCIPFLCFPC